MRIPKAGAALSLIDRIKIGLISSLGYWIIRLIGATLRWEIEGFQSLESVTASGKRAILAFWHGRIFMATYRFRNRGIVVMTSQNRDGEYLLKNTKPLLNFIHIFRQERFPPVELDTLCQTLASGS